MLKIIRLGTRTSGGATAWAAGTRATGDLRTSWLLISQAREKTKDKGDWCGKETLLC